MTLFERRLVKSCEKWLGSENVTFVDGWKTRKNGRWRYGSGNKPVMALAHHTAGGDSKAPGGNSGVVQYVIHRGTRVPYANAVIDSDGHVYICSAGPVWHAGRGSFKGTRWERWGIPDNMANWATWGTEVVSAGLKKDFSLAEKKALRRLHCAVREAAGWKGFKYRLANHKDWTSRKIDTQYSWKWLLRGARKVWSRQSFGL